MKYVCLICGYVYDGEVLPQDFICPICKHPASDFELIGSVSNSKWFLDGKNLQNTSCFFRDKTTKGITPKKNARLSCFFLIKTHKR